MKKTLQILGIILLVLVIFIITVGVFNPFNLRNKFVGGMINGMLDNTLEEGTDDGGVDDSTNGGAETVITDHPLLDDSQEQILEDLGVDISQLPTTVTPELESCLVDAVGEQRAIEIAGGATPSITELFKAKGCL